MDLMEYRDYYLNQIKATAIEEERYCYEVFFDLVAEIMISEWSLLSSINQCHFSVPTGTRAFKSMLIHAGSLELSTNTVNLLYADFNADEVANITNTDISTHSTQMINFVENALKGYFSNGEQSNPAVQLGLDIKRSAADIYKIHLFIISTNRLSKRVKNIDLEDVDFQGKTYKVELDLIDIEKIYNAQLANSEKEDTIIKVLDYGTEGIPCIRADIGAGRYEAYLAVVPGEFLSNIYKKFGPRLLERNVRSFLQFRGGVNKGIRATILNERENFFSYNNGISSTAQSVTLEDIPGRGQCITSFTDFQIINGGQTTASLASASIKDNAPLDRIFVQMKLTIILEKGERGDEFVRATSQFANSQNKVTTADLVSNHQFYLRIEEFSRKLYAPTSKGLPYQTIWFFERSRGQYEQPKMKMTKGERAAYERVNPSSQKFDNKDLARYINSADMCPYHVSWGGEVNAVRFQSEMEKQWKANPAVFNESYFRDLVAKAIIFNTTRKTILKQDWYKERSGYLIQNVTYAFAKLIYEVQRLGLVINYRYIWDKQELPDFLIEEITQIALITREVFFCPNIGNVETYCKKPECWDQVKQLRYELSFSTKSLLISKDDNRDEKAAAKKEQRFTDGINIEVDIFNLGADYWNKLSEVANAQGVLSYGDIQLLKLATEYCSGKRELTHSHFKKIMEVREKIKGAQIPV